MANKKKDIAANLRKWKSSESDSSSDEKWKMPLWKMQKLERSNYYAMFLSNTMEIIVIHRVSNGKVET
jgi:hypothetical protein